MTYHRFREAVIRKTNAQLAILFADVCDSTTIYQSVGDTQALAMISRMLDLVQQKAGDAGGKVVKSLGDGLVCQFGEVDAAFRAACEMQSAAALLEPAEETDHKLAIKVVFTWGPVVTEGGDVFGDTVNVCARLVAIANPAQVLTTKQTVEALSPGLRKRTRELYATKVRGRASQVTVCEVMWRADPDVTRVDGADAPAQAKAQWVLKLTHAGETYTVGDDAVVRIGRDSTNDVVVLTEHASRMHARVFSKDEQFVIADQSSNGTYVMVDGNARELRLRRGEALLGERGWIGLGKSAAKHGDHVLRYRLERRSN